MIISTILNEKKAFEWWSGMEHCVCSQPRFDPNLAKLSTTLFVKDKEVIEENYISSPTRDDTFLFINIKVGQWLWLSW